jgi:hypothetical protein
MQPVCGRYLTVIPEKCTSKALWKECPLYRESLRERQQAKSLDRASPDRSAPG